MAAFGYGSVPDRAFVAFERELEEGEWKEIATKKYEDQAKESAAALLHAPQPAVWKLRLRFGIAGVLAALGAPSLTALDDAWDAAQRRLFHRIAAAADDEKGPVRDAADRLSAQLLTGSGTGQTALDFDAEVDFGRQQILLTSEGGPLAADAKKIKITDVLADVGKATEALGQGLGRASGEKRKAPSRKLREAVADCAAAFNSVHEGLAWFIAGTPKGHEHDRLEALLAPLEALLSRNAPAAPQAPAAPPAAPAALEPPAKPG